ncbi:MAG: BspA family leucine-rich repeat surface protein [Draconibacterium sp.]
MVQFLRSFIILFISIMVVQVVFAQLPYTPGDGKPSNIIFSTTAPDGQYNTGDVIRLEAEFDDWLGLGSEIKVRLNTGDTIAMTFNPKLAEDILDPNWGREDKRNAILGGHNNVESYGVYCILELEGKGGHSENKGKFVLGGGFHNYEEYDVTNPTSRSTNEGHDMLVVTDHDGKLVQGFGHHNDQTNNPDGFRYEVRWVIETQDGGLLVVGAFTNYGGNDHYDYIVKFKYNSASGKFEIDTDFMDNLTAGGTVACADGPIPDYIDSWGKPQRAVLQDDDGYIYVTGDFTQVSGTARNSIAKLTPEGVLVTDFNFPYSTTATGTTSFARGSILRGGTMTFDDDDPNKIWWAYGQRVYCLHKSTGNPMVDQNNDGLYNEDDWAQGPDYGALAITLMPNEDQYDSEGNPGPGGVLVTGRGSPNRNSSKINPATGDYNWGWYCSESGLLALQDDLSTTPINKFALAGTSSYGTNITSGVLNGWAIDGAAFLKGKMWIGLHEGAYQSNYTNPGENYYEGGLVVLNYNGTLNTSFNHMLANATEQTNIGRPDGNYRGDGIGGNDSGGGNDIISLYVTSDDDLMVGGSYGSIMQYGDNGYATSTGSVASKDDQIITRIIFRRAIGYYYPSPDDIVPNLKIVEILDGHTISGAFGEEAGPISMDNIQQGDEFENNHFVGINMPYSAPEDAFITTWEVPAGEDIEILTDNQNLGYRYFVDWGNGTTDQPNISGPYTSNATHTYTSGGVKTVKIYCGKDDNSDGRSDGTGFSRIYHYVPPSETPPADHSRYEIRSIEQWGSLKWRSMERAFHRCNQLVSNATDAPDLSLVTSTREMFYGAENFTGYVNHWDVSTIEDMRGMFCTTSFNDSVANWNVENVIDMGHLFRDSPFNKPIGKWKVGKVEQMDRMFENSPFNQEINDWNVGEVIDMEKMFYNAETFNQELSKWTPLKVTDMRHMFAGATNFDQNIGGWDISALTTAENIFLDASLSQENYDALLVSWWKLVRDGTANTNVKFHGGASTWCMGEDARRLLIDNGWGDGDPGGSYSNTSTEGIIDGGTACSGQFITQWILPDDKTITIQRKNNTGAAMDISWGDGVVQYGLTGEPTHIYGTAYNPGDTVTLKMYGGVSMYWAYGEDSPNLVKVVQFGDIAWQSMENMFAFANNMVFVDSIDVPILDGVTNMAGTFWGCQKFNSSLSAWNVSEVTNMNRTFYGASAFNNGEEAFNWGEKTANVESFKGTFSAAIAFNQDINNWNVNSATIMENMFAAANSFNSPLNDWLTGSVLNMKHMFDGAGSFDQNIGGWDITALTDADNMFHNAELSVANYDSLLIGWGKQVENETAKTKVHFHGGTSKYCKGTAYRELLIDNGWGDGVLNAQNNEYLDIVDGGSLAPDINDVLFSAPGIFQNEQALITLENTADTLVYHARAIPDGDTVSVIGNNSNNVVLNMDSINETSHFVLWANSNTEGCEINFDDTLTVNVYPVADLDACTISLETQGQTKIANGTDLHQIKVTIVDIVDGSPIENAQVIFGETANVSFAPNDTLYTGVDGTVTLNISSEKAGEYETNVKVFTYNPEDEDAFKGGDINQSNNPVSYTFSPNVPTALNSKVELLTAGADIVADGIHFHKFLATIKDANNNPVPNVEVRFNATTANAGADKVRFYWVDNSVIPNDTTFFNPGSETTGLLTNNQGLLTVYATSTKAWIDFSSSIEFDDGTGSSTFVEFNQSPITYSYVNGVVDYFNSTISATPIEQTVGDSITLTITLVDAYLNACPNETAIFRQAKLASNSTTTDLVSYNSIVGRVSGLTDANGQFSVKASSEKVGKYKTEGTLIFNGNEVQAGKYVSYDFLAGDPDPENISSYVELTENYAIANNTMFNEITVTIADAFGNPVKDANVKILADVNIDWGNGSDTDRTVSTNASGKAVFYGKTSTAGDYNTTVYVETAGNYQAIATQTGANPSRLNPVQHTFLAGEANFGATELYIEPPVQVADGVSQIWVHAVLKDNAGNVVPGGMIMMMYNPFINVTKDNDTESLVTDANGNWILTADANGQLGVYVTSTTPGTYRTNGGIYDGINPPTAHSMETYTFVPGPAEAANSKVTVSLDNQVVATADSLKIELFDAQDNALDTIRTETTVVFSATEGVSINSQTVGGEYTHTLQVGDTAVFYIPVISNIADTFETSVAIGGSGLSGSPVSYSFIAGAPDKENSVVEIINNGALIGGNDTVFIKATIVDSYLNPVPHVNIGFLNEHKSEGWLNFGHGTGSDGAKATDENGVAIAKVTSSKIGPVDSWVAFSVNGWDASGFTGNAITNGGSPAEFYFIDEYTTVDKTKNMAIRAKWYVVDQVAATTHSNAAAIDSAGVQAWYLSGDYKFIPIGNVVAEGLGSVQTGYTQPNKIKFTVTDTYFGNTLSRDSVVASVGNDNTTFGINEELAIYAVDYALSPTTAINHNRNEAIVYGEVKTWSLSNWDKRDLNTTTSIESSQMAQINTGAANVYPLDFTVNNSGQSLAKSVNVTVIENDSWFVTTWEVQAGETITIPTNGAGYDFSIDWGDGSNIEFLQGSGPFSHTYSNTSIEIFTIRISGVFPRIWFNGGAEGQQIGKILSVEQWGAIQWTSMESAFEGCSNLTIAGTAGVPVLSGIESMREMFKNCTNLNSPTLSNWNVQGIENMKSLFYGATTFNQELNWTVTDVLYMNNMFHGAKLFNQDLSGWNVNSVTEMEGMFEGAEAFNNKGNPINWNTQQVSTMVRMFHGAVSFDQDLGKWPINSLTDADDMFKHVKLSVANYDSLLIGWNRQMLANDANVNVKFHGGLSEYCEGESARANLITYGWGDGALGGDSEDNIEPTTGIADGGSGVPVATYTFGPDMNVCLGSQAELVLNSSELNVNYQLYNKADNTAVGNPVAGTDAEISFFVSPIDTTTYYVEAVHTDFICTTIMEDEITVFTDPLSVGGNIIPGDGQITEVCSGDNNTRLELVNYIGNILRWESSLSGDFSDLQTISVTSSSIDVANLLQTKSYRAVVKSGVCDEVYSDTLTLIVDKPSVGGVLAGSATVCSGANSTTLTLSGHIGDVIRWEASTDNFATEVITVTNTSISYDATDLTTTTYYRAVVQSGVCDEAYSSVATVTVDEVSVGGTTSVTDAELCNGSTADLSLSGSLGAIQWQSASNTTSTTPADGDFSNITGATNAAYTSETLSATTDTTYYFYRAVVRNGVCDADTSDVTMVTVYQETEGGSIFPATTTVSTGTNSTELSLNGQTGEVVRWESSLDNFTTPGTEITNTSTSHIVSNLTVTTYYRAVVQNGVCEQTVSEVAVINVDAASEGGSISPAATTVCSGTNSTELTLSGYTGDVVRWESSTDNFASHVVITNTTATYIAEDLTATTSYRAVVQNGVSTEVYSNIATIAVDAVSLGGSTSTIETELCAGSTATLTLTGSTGSIQWQQASNTNGNTPTTYADIAGAVATTYTSSTLTADSDTTYYFYRAVVTSGVCDADTSNVTMVTVYPESAGGTTSVTDAELCNGSTADLTLTGSLGNIQWQSASNSTGATPVDGDFSNITGASNAAYTSEALSATTDTTYYFYRAVVSSGVCDADISSVTMVTVFPESAGGTTSATDTELCNGSTADLTLTGSLGNIQWQSASNTTGATPADGDFSNITGATNAAYTSEPLSATTDTTYYFYRAVVSNGVCDADISSVTMVTVYQDAVGGNLSPGLTTTASDTTITTCSGSFASLRLEEQLGTIIRWESSTDNFDDPANTVEIAHTDESYNTGFLTDTTYYRVVIKNGTCAIVYSATATVNVDPYAEMQLNSVTIASASGGVEFTMDITNNSTTTAFAASTEAVAFYCGEATTALHVGALPEFIAGENKSASVVVPNSALTGCSELIRVVIVDKGQGIGVGTQGDCEPLNNSAVTDVFIDYGDLPVSYTGLTMSADGGAKHMLVGYDATGNTADLMLGTNVSSETDGAESSDASADTYDDGISVSYQTNRSQIVLNDIKVTNNTGNIAHLYGWFGINNVTNNTFYDTDRSYVEIPATAGEHIVSLTFSDYNYAIEPGNYFIRLRVGSEQSEVERITGVATNGEVEDHMICIYPDTLNVDDAHGVICSETDLIDLNNTIQYVPQSGKTIQWFTANGTLISNGNNFDASAYSNGDIVELHYVVEETYCDNVNITGAGKLYLEIRNEIVIEDKEVYICKSDAEVINLNTIMGVYVPGQWSVTPSESSIHLSDNHFMGRAAYNDALGGDQIFKFHFVPGTESCVINTPVITVIITEEF